MSQPRSIPTIALEDGFVTASQLQHATFVHTQTGERLEEVLKRLHYVREEGILAIWSRHLDLPVLDLEKAPVDPEVVRRVPAYIAHHYHVVPITQSDAGVVAAVADPFNSQALELLRVALGEEISLVLATRRAILKTLEAHHQPPPAPPSPDLSSTITEAVEDEPARSARHFLRTILELAVNRGATLVLVEPEVQSFVVRMQLKGVLQDVQFGPERLHAPVLAQLKLAARLDVTERHHAQAGRLTRRSEVGEAIFRVETQPGENGERALLELLSIEPVSSRPSPPRSRPEPLAPITSSSPTSALTYQRGLASELERWLVCLPDLTALLNEAVATVTRVMGVQVASLLLWDEAVGALTLRAQTGLPPEVARHGHFAVGDSPDSWVFREGQPLLIVDIEVDPRFARPSWSRYKTRSLLAVPLMVRGHTVGVLNVNNKLDPGPFTKDDEELLTAVASQISHALDAISRHQRRVRDREHAKEQAVARELQTSLLPSALPDFAGLTVAADTLPAFEAGGDFYDAFTSSDGAHFFIIGDVSAKGVPAATVMAMVRCVFRTLATEAVGPARMLAVANRLLLSDLKRRSMFITTQCIMYRPETARVVVASAGHVWPLVSTGGPFSELAVEGLPLGVAPDTSYGETSVPVGSGHALLLYTDGVVECTSPTGELLGFERLATAATASGATDAKARLQALFKEIITFTAGGPLRDDTTAMTICWK